MRKIIRKHMKTTIIIATCVVCGIMTGGFIALTHDLPQIRALESFKPSAVTRIYSSDGQCLAELFVEKRDPVPLKLMPQYLTKALLTTEDRRFYNHNGIDFRGIMRAALKDIIKRKFVEGASTITQQLAKTLFLTHEKTFVRKGKEAILAIQLERRYTKDEILELYLNQIYFGSGAYGVQSAAMMFFGKQINELNLAECALLAAMPRAPSLYSPLANPKLAKKRRNIVLMVMKNKNIITQSEHDAALQEPVTGRRSNRSSVHAPYFVEYVKKRLEKDFGSALLYKGGLKIETTLSLGLQQAAIETVEIRLAELEKRMKSAKLSVIDPQAALICIDVATGGIIAMVGGKNYEKSRFNRATAARRQPGSAFKPILYACAVESGYEQNHILMDTPAAFSHRGNKSTWQPKNYGNTFKGEMTMRKALALSRNIPAVRLIEALSCEKVIEFGKKMGIKSKLSANLSLSLGTSGVTLTELTAAFAVFPNRGKYIRPYGIVSVKDSKGRMLWKVNPEQSIAMSRAGSAIMADMLQAVVIEGTGKKSKIEGHYVAGKTGTTNNCKDALYVGFSPDIATGVWVGQDKFITLGKKETGSKAAIPIWKDFMQAALEKREVEYFDIPDNVIQRRFDMVNGHVLPVNSAKGISGLFRK
ncbi:penicillin-binding protein 1A [Desulfobacterales bacterium HSG16]|nr:penicillin-binding protein 1A [Desulfobacterales bacterium HSG16]